MKLFDLKKKIKKLLNGLSVLLQVLQDFPHAFQFLTSSLLNLLILFFSKSHLIEVVKSPWGAAAPRLRNADQV